MTIRKEPGPARARAIGCLAVLLLLVSVPLGIFGLTFYMEANDSKGATPLSGLSAIGEIIGVAIMAVAAVSAVAGAILFIRSAKD